MRREESSPSARIQFENSKLKEVGCSQPAPLLAVRCVPLGQHWCKACPARPAAALLWGVWGLPLMAPDLPRIWVYAEKNPFQRAPSLQNGTKQYLLFAVSE